MIPTIMDHCGGMKLKMVEKEFSEFIKEMKSFGIQIPFFYITKAEDGMKAWKLINQCLKSTNPEIVRRTSVRLNTIVRIITH